MKKRLLSVLVSTAMVVGLLAGCGGSKDKDTTGASGDQVSLRFIDVSPSPERQAYYEGVFESFEEETGVAVSYESVPWDDAADKLTVLGTSGELPDVITTHSLWLGQFTEADWILPLDEYVEEHEDQFIEAVKKFNWAQEKENYGHVYSVPDGFMVKGIFYRKDWVEEIGYEIPTGDDWTYDAYFDLIKALTDEEQNRYGNSFRGSRGAFDPILTYLESFSGGYVYDEEGNFILNTPECVEALEKWGEIYTDGYVPQDSVNWGFVEMVDNFTGGLTGTLSNDSEVAITCEEKMDSSEWGVLPMPVSSVDGSIMNSAGSPYSYTIAKSSEHPDEAIQLLDYLVNAENNIEYCKIGGLIPINNDVADDPTYGEDGAYAVFLEQLNDPEFTVPPMYGPFSYTDLHQDMFHTELQKYLLGQQSAEDVLNNIGEELTTRMKEYLAANEGAVIESPKKLQE
ncbi:MAG: ABC transporter substrate-binding protein [Lachnospiraceae bacterium]